VPVDFEGGSGLDHTTDVMAVSLTRSETELLLGDAHRAFNTKVEDLLLTALLLAVRSWTGSPAMLVEMEAHGREDVIDGVDVSRTVGWFTAAYPLRLELVSGASEESESELAVRALKHVKEQLRSVPHHGLGFGLLRWLTRRNSRELPRGAEAMLGSLEHEPDITFN